MTAAKEKKSQAGRKDEQGRASPDEVFDSSRYDAMKDMAEGADLQPSNVETLSDPNAAASLEQKQAGNKEPADMPKTTPMMVEERARTLRDANEDFERKPLQEKDRFLLYLNIALSVENAAVERLHARIQQCQLPHARERLVRHLEETREQKNRLVSLIQKLGGQATGERAQLPEWSPQKRWPTPLKRPSRRKSRS